MPWVNRGALATTVTVSRDPDRSGNFVCDGTDDDVEINAAISYVAALGGGEVKLLQGEFKISASISIDADNVSLVGCGPGATRIVAAANVHGIEVAAGHSHILIANLELDGSATTATASGIYLDGASGSEITYCLIVNCYVHDWHIDGVSLYYADNNGILGNQIISNGYDGIYIYHSNRNLILGNQANSNGEHGICIYYYSDRNLILGNQANSNGENGIQIDDHSNRNLILGNQANSNDSGIRVQTYSNNNVISGNETNDNIFEGIYLYYNVSNNVISGNEVRNNDNHGIYLYSSVNNNVVTGNQVYNNSQASSNSYDGIYLYDSNNNLISNNVIDGGNNHRYGINIANDGCNDNLVVHNRLLRNVTAHINDAGTGTKLQQLIIPATDTHDPNTYQSHVGQYATVCLKDAADIKVRFSFRAPTELQQLVRAAVLVHPWAHGDIYRSVAVDYTTCGDLFNKNEDSIAAGAETITYGSIHCLDITAALDAIGPGDLVGVEFTRLGTAAEDTIDSSVDILGLYLEYV